MHYGFVTVSTNRSTIEGCEVTCYSFQSSLHKLKLKYNCGEFKWTSLVTLLQVVACCVGGSAQHLQHKDKGHFKGTVSDLLDITNVICLLCTFVTSCLCG